MNDHDVRALRRLLDTYGVRTLILHIREELCWRSADTTRADVDRRADLHNAGVLRECADGLA
jgi:hypothetical protein